MRLLQGGLDMVIEYGQRPKAREHAHLFLY
jgi:hypothetical protein